MTLQLKLNGVDFTAKWRPYESRWSSRAWNGESSTSEFVIDDFDGAIDHDDLNARKIVEVWEDASGSPKCLYRGRISNKALGMGPAQWQPAMRWTIQAEDYNIDLRGIRVNEAERPDETDEDRFEAIRLAMLVGAASTHPQARDSTDLGNTYLGGGTAIVLPTEHYTDTFPGDIFQQIVELTGRIFFVYTADDGTGELYYGDRSDMSLLSDIEIDDDAPASADGIDKFAPYKGPQAGDHGGQGVLTGGAVRYGDGSLYEDSNIGGSEAVYDRWETTVTNDFIHNPNTAQNLLNKTVTNHDEDQTYFAIIDMRPEDAHRIKAGMMVPLTRKRANKIANDAARAVVVTHEPVKPNADGESWYRVTLELGRPQTAGSLPKSRRILPHPPNQPVPPTPGTCTRYYFTTDNTGLPVVTRDGSWDKGNGNNGMSIAKGLLKTTTSSAGTPSWGLGTTSVPLNFQHGQFFLALSAGDVEGTVKSIIKAKRRTGTGVTSSQRHQAQMVIRVVSNDGTVVRGTVLDDHSPGTLDSAFFQSTYQTIKFPASSQWADSDGAVLTPVTAQAGDWLVVEIGSHTVTDGTGTGAAMQFGATDGADYPATEFVTTDGDPWIDLCTPGTAGSSGSTPEDIGGTPAPGDTGIWADLGHVHGHGDVNYDGTTDHDARSIEYDNDDSGLTAENVQDAIDELADDTSAPSIGVPHNHPDYAEAAYAITAAPDGGWGRITKTNVVSYGGHTYIGFVTGDTGDCCVMVVANDDPETVLNTIVIHPALEVDDHAAPSLLVRDSDHKLLTAYCAHSGTNFWTRLSTTSLDTDPDLGDGFAAEVSRDAVLGGSSYTFANLYELTAEGDIWLVYREGANAEWFRSISADNGATFGAPTKILTESGETPYLKGIGNGIDRIDFVSNELNPAGGNASVYHFKYAGGDFLGSDGNTLTVPIDSTQATLVAGDGSVDYSFMDIAHGVDGNPVIAFADISDVNAHVYHWARWDGGAWTDVVFVPDAGGGIDVATETYSGHVALDGADPSIVYASREVAGEFEMYRYTTPDGVSWVEDPLTSESLVKNIRPMSWPHRASTLRVVWMRGDYTGFTTWDTGTHASGVLDATGGEPIATAHIADPSDAHDASAVSIVDAGGYYTGTDVEAALQEVGADLASATGGIGPILISDTPSTPLVFADLIQNEAQDDLVYADP